MNKVVIIGAGGFGREVHQTLNYIKEFELVGYVDDHIDKGTVINGYPVLGGLDWFENNKAKAIIAVGDPKSRKRIAETITDFENIIHPTSIISETSTINQGVVIQSNCVITVNVKIGKHVHVNIFSSIGHDCIVGDYVTLSPDVHINGNVTVGDGTFFGSGVQTIQGIDIGKNCVIGAGAVVIDDVPDNSLYVGIPAKFKKNVL